jgi:hypothetical protein
MLPEKGATVNCAGIGHHLLTLRPEPQGTSARPARHLDSIWARALIPAKDAHDAAMRMDAVPGHRVGVAK